MQQRTTHRVKKKQSSLPFPVSFLPSFVLLPFLYKHNLPSIHLLNVFHSISFQHMLTHRSNTCCMSHNLIVRPCLLSFSWNKELQMMLVSTSMLKTVESSSESSSLTHPKYLKTETETNSRTYGMRPDDCSSVSEMCYVLIVAWLCTPEVVLIWWLAVAWCTSMEQKLAGTEAHGDRVLPRPGPSDWPGVWKPACSHHGELPQLLVHSWAGGSLALQLMCACVCVCIIICILSMRLTNISDDKMACEIRWGLSFCRPTFTACIKHPV